MGECHVSWMKTGLQFRVGNGSKLASKTVGGSLLLGEPRLDCLTQAQNYWARLRLWGLKADPTLLFTALIREQLRGTRGLFWTGLN